jgi:hypothetical protein
MMSVEEMTVEEILQWVETNPSNIRKHPYFPYRHPFLSPHGTTLTAFDTDVYGC